MGCDYLRRSAVLHACALGCRSDRSSSTDCCRDTVIVLRVLTIVGHVIIIRVFLIVPSGSVLEQGYGHLEATDQV